MKARQHNPTIAFLIGTLGIALFSGMDAVMKGLVLSIGTFATMFWRNLIGLVMSGSVYGVRRLAWPKREVLKIHVMRGVLSAGMGFLFFWGLARVPIAQAVALAFVSPLVALYLASLLLHEQVGRRTVLGSVIAFAGILIIFAGQARAELGHEALLGSLAIIASATLYAMNIILMRQQSLLAEPVEIAFFQSLTVSAVLLLVLPIAGVEVPQGPHWPWLTFAAALAFASMLLLSWAYARAEASYLATTEYTAFLWAALFGWLVFGEPLELLTVSGAVLIVAGCILAARRPEEASPALEAAG
ncbi:MAG: DMT family transporter [Sphingomicrobium sp.]